MTKCLGIATILYPPPHLPGLKYNWTNKYNHNEKKNCLKSGTHGHQRLFPPLWCFARPLLQLTSVVVCLWVFLPLVLFSASEMHAQLGWDQEIDLAIAEYSTFWPESVALYTSEWIRLLLSSVNTSNPVPLEAMHAHAFTLLHHVSQMMFYDSNHELFRTLSSRHSGTGWS